MSDNHDFNCPLTKLLCRSKREESALATLKKQRDARALEKGLMRPTFVKSEKDALKDASNLRQPGIREFSCAGGIDGHGPGPLRRACSLCWAPFAGQNNNNNNNNDNVQ